MQLKTLLIRGHPVTGFAYEKQRIVEDPTRPTVCRIDVQVQVRARLNGQGACSCCGCRGPRYDTLSERRLNFVPLWGISLNFTHATTSPPRRRRRSSSQAPTAGVNFG